MPRIPPIDEAHALPAAREELDRQRQAHGRVTNMKRTLAHSPAALLALMQWYPLHDEVQEFLGARLTTIFAHAVSTQSDCLICSTFFRRLLIESGEDPDRLMLDSREAAVVAYGRAIAQDSNNVPAGIFDAISAFLSSGQIVALTAFAAMMIATNIFNNVLAVDLDEYLQRVSENDRSIGLIIEVNMPGQFHGKTALITGAANGQGRATAIALAREGANVVALDVARQLAYPGYALGTPQGLESLAAEIRGLGVQCLPFAADVRDDAAVTAAVSQAIATLGRIDILFNNAGICAYGLAHELTEDEWDAMLDINLKGAWLVARRVIPHMIRQKSGVILNNSSIAGLRGMNRLSHYAASKWGLVGLTKSWALELGPHNIRVISIHPTGVNTPMNDGLAAMEGLTPQQIAERSAGNLLPVPWIEPRDVAEAVVYLASDKARFITGSQFVLDAGLLTR